MAYVVDRFLRDGYTLASTSFQVDAFLRSSFVSGTVNHALTADGITATVELGMPAVVARNLVGSKSVDRLLPVRLPPLFARIVKSARHPGGPVAALSVHALTADGISTIPELATPILSQNHALTAPAALTTTPQLATPALTQNHVFTAPTALAVGTPELGTPALSQNHALSGDVLSTTPTLGTPAITQGHSLSGDGLSTAPVLGTPIVAQGHVLSASGVSTTPELATPAMAQSHVLTGDGISTTPELGTPALTQNIATNPSSTIDRLKPVLQPPDFARKLKTARIPGHWGEAVSGVNALTADGISATVELGMPALYLYIAAPDVRMVSDIAIALPFIMKPFRFVFEKPFWQGVIPAAVDALSADGITVGSPAMATPTIGQDHILISDGISATTALGAPALTQVHLFSTDGLSTGILLAEPMVSQDHVLAAEEIITGIVQLGQPSLAELLDFTRRYFVRGAMTRSLTISGGRPGGSTGEGRRQSEALASGGTTRKVLTAGRIHR